MPNKIIFSLIFSLDFKREWAALRHHLLFLNQSMLERSRKIFGFFIGVLEAFATVLIEGLQLQLFNWFDVKGKIWLAIKDLYTDISARVLYEGSLSRVFKLRKVLDREEILSPSICKVCIKG